MGPVLVTGGSGFLGTALCRRLQSARRGEVFAGYCRHEPRCGRGVYLNLLEAPVLDHVLCRVRPALVIHTAYSKDPADQWAVIVEGTRRLVERLGDTRLVHISTDWVFDGRAGPYGENDEPDPHTAYGKAKLAAEQEVQRGATNAVIVRTSLISGTEPLPPRWQAEEAKLRRGQKVVFYRNEIRNPIHVDDLAAALLEVARSDYRGILHIAGPRCLSRFEELQLFVRWRGFPGVLIGSDVSDGKGRPLNCALKTDRFRRRFRTPLRPPEVYWPALSLS